MIIPFLNPLDPDGSWIQGTGNPSRMMERNSNYELYEKDDEFVLSIEMPGFDKKDIEVTWDEGTLYVAGKHVDEDISEKKTFNQRFKMPKEVDSDEINAKYKNGVLEIHLPIQEITTKGRKIEIED